MGMQESKKVRPAMVIKLGGSFCAFMIGAGYASGQEVLQYFTVFGFLGTLLGAIFGIFLYSWMSAELMSIGYETNDTAGTNSYCVLLGKKGGMVMSVFVPAFMFLTYVIMVSGSGATFNQQFGISPQVGAAIMAAVSGVIVLLGLNKVIDTIGFLGPMIAAIALIIGVGILLTNSYDIAASDSFIAAHQSEMLKAADNWFISTSLYVLWGAVMAVPFMAAVGSKANGMREILSGAVFGSVLFFLALMVLSFAMGSQIEKVYDLQIPALAMANSIHPVLGTVYSVVLILAIFTTSLPLLWTVAARIAPEGSKLFYVLVAAIAVLGFFGGHLPFGTLINYIYPCIGWVGLLIFCAVVVREAKRFLAWRRKDGYLSIEEKAALAHQTVDEPANN